MSTAGSVDNITLEILRTRLAAIAEEGALTIEQTSPLPATLNSEKRGSTTLTVEHPSANTAVYTIK